MEKGQDLMPVMLAMVDWSEKYDDQTEARNKFIMKLRKQPSAVRREIFATLQ